jgi:hypothetical protein
MSTSLVAVLAVLVLSLGVVVYFFRRKTVDAAAAIAIAAALLTFFSKPVEDMWDAMRLTEPSPAAPAHTPTADAETPATPDTPATSGTTEPAEKPARTTEPAPTTEATTTEAAPTGADEVAPPAAPEPAFAADLPNTAAHGIAFDGSWDVNGKSFPHSVAMCTDVEPIANINCLSDKSDSYHAEYAAPPQMHAFATAIGISDRSSSDCAIAVKVAVDGAVRFDETVAVRSLQQRRWSLKPGSRVQLTIAPATGNTRCNAVFGDARFEA